MPHKDDAPGLLLAVGMLALSAALYSKLPAQLPIHWNIHGEADGFGAKWWATFLLPTAMLGVWFWTRRKGTPPLVALMSLGVLAYIQGLTLWAGAAGSVPSANALWAAVFLFFALAAKPLADAKPGRGFGVRTPWTLADERVWRRTHRFSGPLLGAAGWIGLAAAVSGAPPALLTALMVVSIGAVVVYSFVAYLDVRGSGRGGRS